MRSRLPIGLLNQKWFFALVCGCSFSFVSAGLEPFAVTFFDVVAPALYVTLIGLAYQVLLFFTLLHFPRIFKLATPVLFILAAVSGFFSQELGIVIDSDIIASAWLTNPQEVSEIFSGDLILSLLITVVILTGLLGWYRWLEFSGARPNRVEKNFFHIPIVWRLLLTIFIVLGIRSIYVPSAFLMKGFSPPHLTIPTTEVEAEALAQYLGFVDASVVSDTSFNLGRVQYDFSVKGRKENLRVLASKGRFEFRTSWQKQTFNAAGILQKHKFYWPKGWNDFFPSETQPFYLLTEIWQVVTHFMKVQSLAVVDITRQPSSSIETVAEDLIVVLVIGEAARSDHFELNGYPRETNPKLMSEDNLISFPSMISCAASTYISVPCLLTRMTTLDLPVPYRESEQKAYIYDPMTQENSLISLFRKHDFATSWLSLNRQFHEKDRAISRLLRESETVKFLDKRRDGSLIPLLAEALLEDERQLIVLHTLGSHWRYASRYPLEFEQFTPACEESLPSRCSISSLVNSYDNSILYTDDFLSNVIGELRNRKALMIYVSDHGESLGEEGIYTHSNMSRPEQRRVPLIIWLSPKLNRSVSDFLPSLRQNQLKEISHDNIFHTVLDCAGIKSPVIEQSLSLCKP